jgi:hypothetical protein
LESPGSIARRLPKRVIFWLPVVFTPVYVFLAAVNLPWHDDWDAYVPLFEKYFAGTLTLGDFWLPHNEHRLFFSTLIVFGTSLITKFNVVPVMLVVQLCILLMLLLMVSAARRHFGFTLSAMPLWFLLVPFLVFSWRQYENYFYCMQLCYAMAALGAVAACFFASRAIDGAEKTLSFLALMAGAAVSATVASFSFASGLFTWPAVLLQLVLAMAARRDVRGKIALGALAWTVLGTMLWSVYFTNLQSANASEFQMVKFMNALVFFIGYLGSPLAPHKIGGIVAGVCVLGVFAYTVRRLHKESRLFQSSFWLGLCLFALLTGWGIAWSRIPWGVFYYLQSRYVAFSILFIVSLLALVHSLSPTPRALKVRKLWIALVMAGLVYGSVIKGLPYGVRSHEHRRELVEILRTFESRTDEELQAMFWPGGLM